MMNSAPANTPNPEGILLLNKPVGKTAFHLVSMLRKATRVKTIGHAGTLDPFATGVMVMLIGRPFTQLSNRFLEQDKEYETIVRLGISTDSYDCDGQETGKSDLVPSFEDVEQALLQFQGTIQQIPPMFSAKKIGGKKLYDLARKGIEIERQPVSLTVKTQLLAYNYPNLQLRISCSKGTYIRSIAHDLGKLLGCGAHLTSLTRLRSGPFLLKDCIDPELMFDPNFLLPLIKNL
jgi:tRNA pseudouridine55 synthase